MKTKQETTSSKTHIRNALPLFKDFAPGIWDRLPSSNIRIDSLLTPNKTGDYIYVITEDHELLVMPAESEFFPNHHATMAAGKSVYAAGEMKFVNGKCVINNQSGGFQPKGKHLKTYVLNIVAKHGIRNAEFNYMYDSEHIDMNNLPENIILPKVASTTQDDSNSAMDNSRVTTLNKIADFLSQFSLIGSASAAELPALRKEPTRMGTEEPVIKTNHPEVAHQKIDYAAELYHYLGALEKGAHFINVPIPEQIKTIRQLIGAFGRNIDNSNIDGSIAMYPDLPAKLANRISTIKKRVGSSADTSVQQVEDAISQFVGGVTQVGIDMVVAKFFALWKLPTVGLSMYKAAAVQATYGATFGITTQNFTTSFAKTGGDLMEKGCKKFFDAERERQNDTSGYSKMVPPDYAGFDVPYFPPLTPKVIPDNEVNEAEKEVVGSDAPIKIEQELPMLTCSKDKSQHRFVTPNFISNRDIEKSNTSDEFIYVITEKGQLKMAKKQSLSTDDSGQYLPATHTDLARGKKVMDVGTIQVQQGKITRVSHGAPDYE